MNGELGVGRFGFRIRELRSMRCADYGILESGKIWCGIEIPHDFSTKIASGEPGNISVLLDASNSNNASIAASYYSRIISKISYDTFSETEGKELGCTNVTAFVEIELKDGQTLSGRADYGKGSKANPMSEAEVTEKFRTCAAYADWPDGKTDAAIDMIWRLDGIDDIRALTAHLAKSE